MARGLVPLPHYYAAIRTDPEAMLRDLGLDDPETLQEAKAMPRKKYLVFLEWPEELPMPGMRWCRYDISPIGTTPRPPDELRGFTSDMVVPIAPNEGHSPNRQPIHPAPSFPFSNCYHWALNRVTVRVRVHGDGVEHDGGIKLPAEEHLALQDTFAAAYERIRTFLHEKYESTSAAEDHVEEVPASAANVSSTCQDSTGGTTPPSLVQPTTQNGECVHVLTDTYYRLVSQRGLRKSGPPSQGSDRSQQLDSSSADVPGTKDAQRQSTVTPVTSRDSGIDLFGWDPDPNTARIPLVDAWLDIDKHLSEDCIPSPLELEKEIVEISALIVRGLERFASAQKTPEQIREDNPVSDIEPPAEPEELGESDRWVEINNGLWWHLRAEYLNSPSSCDPPFERLGEPESPLGEASSIPPHTAEIVVRQQGELSPLTERTNTLPSSARDARRSASPIRSSTTRFAESIVLPSPPSTVFKPTRDIPGVSGAVDLAHSAMASHSTSSAMQSQSPPKHRRSRASTIYHRLRAKFVYFLHAGGGIGEVH